MITMHSTKLITQYLPKVKTPVFWLFLLASLSVFSANAQDIFTKAKLHEIRITTPDGQWYDSLQKFYNAALAGNKHQFVNATVTLDGETVSNVGFRMKGKYSNYGFPGDKKPFRLDFNKFAPNQEFQGLKKLNLHNGAGDPSFLREYMAYDLFAYLGIPAPRASFAKLYINDQYWGCYQITEEPDKTFLKRHFSSKKGNLFECVQSTNLGWHGNLPSAYPQLELKTDSTEGSWDKLLHWIDVFNNNYSFDFQQQLASSFEMERYFKVLATDVLINNEDAYSTNGRNFFLYDDPKSGKIQWIPWDYNLSFWNVSRTPLPQFGNKGEYKPLVYRILKNDYLHTAYLKSFCKLLNNEYREYPFEARSKAAFDLIKEAVETDPHKFYTNADFYKNRTDGVTVSMLRNNVPTDVYLPGLTKLYAKRKAELVKMIFNEGCDCSNIKEDNKLKGIVFPNPVISEAIIYIDDETKDNYVQLSVSDIAGNTVYTDKILPQAGSIRFDASRLETGTYFVKVEVLNKTMISKLIKQ